MKIPLLKRSSFWNLVIQSVQILLGTFQAISLSNEDHVRDFNIYIAYGQGVLAIVSLWTRDTNRNNIIDIAEETTETTITVSSTGPVSVKDVTETKTPENPTQ
jgi:hypothetical protein